MSRPLFSYEKKKFTNYGISKYNYGKNHKITNDQTLIEVSHIYLSSKKQWFQTFTNQKLF